MGGPGSGPRPGQKNRAGTGSGGAGHTKGNTSRPRNYGIKSSRKSLARNIKINKSLPSIASKSTTRGYKQLVTSAKHGVGFGKGRKIRR